MFALKVYNKKENRSQEFTRTIDGIISYIFNKVSSNNAKVISDNSSIEVISGKELESRPDEIMVELLIKKTIIINNEDLKDRSKLDRHLTTIRHFCDQAKSIEEIKYLPINMRHPRRN